MPSLVEVKKVTDGLGMNYGTGTISCLERESQPGNEDLAQKTDDAVTSPLILTPVDLDKSGNMLADDGCGDGRGVTKVFQGKTELNRSLNRPKVFGAGATMAAAVRIGTGQTAGSTLQDTLKEGMADMARKGMDFGAHTDEHADGEKCGCGAIDKAPLIVQAAVQFKDEITAAIRTLKVDTQHLSEVMANYEAYAQEVQGQPYSGSTAMDEIVNKGKIVKQLTGDHLETRVVLNFVEGQTIDQDYVREMTSGRAQVFGVDVWRMRHIADGLATDAQGTIDEAVAEKAFLSELVYTLATAAVLTKGDLPVYAAEEKYVLAA